MKKLLFLALGLGLIFSTWQFLLFYKNKNQFSFLKIKVYPPQANIKINDKIYSSENGNISLKLPAKEYEVEVYLTGYLSYKEKVNLQPKQTYNLTDIYLLPLNWNKSSLVQADNIKSFLVSEGSNRIFYINEKKENNTKTIYQWFIYERETKTNQEIYSSSLLPSNLSFLSKKVIFTTKPNNWQILLSKESLLRSLNIVTQSLNNLLEKRIKELDLKIDRNIKKVIFIDPEETKLLIQTKNALLIFNLLSDDLEILYEGEASNFLFLNGDVYFIEQSGLLEKLTIESKVLEPVSWFKFNNSDLETIKILKLKDKDEFLIKDSLLKLYYLNKEEVPVLIEEGIKEANFTLDSRYIIYNTNDEPNIWRVYNLSNKHIEKTIKSDILPLNFFKKNYWLIIKDNNLGIYDDLTGQFSKIDEKIEPAVYFDPVLKKIFYSKKGEIIIVSY